MVSLQEQIDAATSTKQNFANTDNDVDLVPLVDREKLRVWNKITRVVKDSVEVAVIIPFGKFFEPFYNDYDIDDTVTNAAEYDSTNGYVRLYRDPNGNRKVLQSKVLAYEYNRNFRSVTVNVNAEYVDGSDAIDGIDIEIYNGNEWIAINNNVRVFMREYSGSDLDADLDADLYASLGNFVGGGTGFDYEFDFDLGGWLFQNQLKYRVTRVSDDDIRVTKVKIDLEWDRA